MRFTTWLKKQRDRNDWIGDLAVDARDDETWPEDAKKYKEFNSYLRDNHACDNCLQAFHDAWIEYGGRPAAKCPGAKCAEENCAEEGCQLDWFVMHGYEPYKNESKSSRERRKLTPVLRFQILQRDNFLCCLCGQGVADGKKIEVDHKVPVSKGGKTVPENLWTLCFECNRGKSVQVMP